MKVLMICNNEISYNPRLLKAADFLSEKNVEVVVYNPVLGIGSANVYEQTIAGKNWRIIENDLRKNKSSSYRKWAFVSVVHKITSTLWNKFRWKIGFDRYLNKGLYLNKINFKEKFDYIYINLVDNLPFAVKLKRATGAKIIYDSQEYFVGQYQKYGKNERDWVTEAERKYIHDIDLLIGTTNVMKEKLIEDYNLKIPSFRLRNVPSRQMLSMESNTASLNSGKVYLVWHGMGIYLNNTRGVHILVQALAKCKSNVALILQGSLPPDQKIILDGYIQSLGLEGKIIIRPPAEPYAIVASLRNCDIGLIGELPQEDNQKLTSSNKLFDYINAGLAVIASDLPGINETVKQYNVGLSFQPGNVEELASCIDTLANDPIKLKEYKIRAAAVSERELFWENDFQHVWNSISA